MIAIGCDHAGVELKKYIISELSKKGFEFEDMGTDGEPCDYPDMAEKVCRKVTEGVCERGILICGTGIGMSIAANKIDGIRCAHCTDTYSAAMAKQHNNANVIAIGARITGSELAKCIVKSWLESEFLGGRHAARVEKIMKLEN